MGQGRSALDEARDALLLAGGNERAEFVLRVVVVAVAQRSRRTGQVGDQPLVDPGTGVDAARGGAILAGVVEAERAQPVHHGRQIGVVEHDHRGFAAKLQVRALDRAFRGLDHLAAGADVPGQADHVDARMVDQALPDARTTPVDDVDDTGGEQLGEHRGEMQQAERRQLGRLDDDGVARRPVRARASRRPSSAGSSTVRPARSRPPGRAAPSMCGRPCTRPRAARCRCGRHRRRSGSSRRWPGSRRPGTRGAACRCCGIRGRRSPPHPPRSGRRAAARPSRVRRAWCGIASRTPPPPRRPRGRSAKNRPRRWSRSSHPCAGRAPAGLRHRRLRAGRRSRDSVAWLYPGRPRRPYRRRRPFHNPRNSIPGAARGR